MADLSHAFGGDLQLSPTGNLALASGTVVGQQRVLRRLLTNPGAYLWQLTYGAGLGAFVGQPNPATRMRALARSQMRRESAVARSPAPTADVIATPGRRHHPHAQLRRRGDRRQRHPQRPGVGVILALRNFTQTVQDAAAAAQGAASTALDFTVGGPLRALTEASASVALWLQYVALQVLSATRLATSNGSDVDSFVADYSLVRLPAVAATGVVTLARYSSAAQAVVLPGAQVKTTDGTQVFTVAADPTNAAWNATLGYLVVPAGVAGINATVTANAAGPGGNVLAGSITLLATAVAGIDTVSNAVGFTTGAAAESDAALRTRFALYLASLSRATLTAVGSAIAGVQSGLSYVIVENTPGLGRFAVTVDDGSGAPTAGLLALVYAAVDAVRPVGSVFSVAGPTVVPASVAIILAIPANVARPPVVAAVNAAVTAYVASLGVGASLLYGRLFQLAFDALPPFVTGATITLNGAAIDLPSGATGVIRASSISVA